MSQAESLLIDEIGGFAADPLGYVKFAFPWGEPGELEKYAGPRQWQAEIDRCIGNHLRSADRFEPLLIAVASGHGIGKSAEIAHIINWGISTCEDCKVILTANTATQLETKTWPELVKWTRLSINAHWWDIKATSIAVKEKGHEKLWRVDAIPWTEQRPEAFAGAHNQGKRIVVIFDEASAIPSKIWEVTEGALTDAGTEIIWIAFGNPTQNTGRFRECFGKYKHRWKTYQIDSRTVEDTNKAQIEKWVEDYGEDSDFVRVRVRGEFPRAGTSQFIASDIVAAARRFKSEGHEALPRIVSVDVARYGEDQTVIGLRQGRKFKILEKLRGQGTVQVGLRVMAHMDAENPDAVIVDGDGIGGGVIDVIRHHGYGGKLHEFHGAVPAHDAAMYFNRRAEIWGMTRDWLRAGAEIPDDPELEADLIGPEYFFSTKNQIQLEKKDDMKARGLSSPDLGDCLAMSFAVNVMPKPRVEVSVYAGDGGWMA